jgi:hypothetical protein
MMLAISDLVSMFDCRTVLDCCGFAKM